jgi:carbamoyl-phosphate synthase large subunit
MKSTGEVMGGAGSFGMAFVKAMLAPANAFPKMAPCASPSTTKTRTKCCRSRRDWPRLASRSSARAARRPTCGRTVSIARWSSRSTKGGPSLADEIVNRKISMVINTPHGRESFFDDKAVRRAAMMAGVPCITTITGAAAALEAIRALKTEGLDVRALQDYYAAVAAQ